MTELMLCLLVLGNDPSGVPAARAEVVDLQAEQSRGVRQLKLMARALRAELAIKRRLPATPANDAAIALLEWRLIEIEGNIQFREGEIAFRRIHGRQSESAVDVVRAVQSSRQWDLIRYVPACTGRPKPTNYLMLKGAAAPTLHPVTALRFNGADAHNSRSDMAPGRSWSAKAR